MPFPDAYTSPGSVCPQNLSFWVLFCQLLTAFPFLKALTMTSEITLPVLTVEVPRSLWPTIPLVASATKWLPVLWEGTSKITASLPQGEINLSYNLCSTGPSEDWDFLLTILPLFEFFSHPSPHSLSNFSWDTFLINHLCSHVWFRVCF